MQPRNNCSWKMASLGLALILLHAALQSSSSIVASAARTNTGPSGCPPAFKGKCQCGFMSYQDRSNQSVVNCTNAGFKDTTVLEHLPPHTQVLLFTGNHLPELPWNVFGTDRDLDALRIVDLSNNGIRSIKGKTFHRATGVERLVLNYNDISLTLDGEHPRLLTNFPNLRELHLTGAFAKEGVNQGGEKSLGIDQLSSLQAIFETGNLTMLVKLHLEQNRISSPIHHEMFCSLKALLDLHLGDNWLSADSLPDLQCLPRLRFLDLGRNHFESLSLRTMEEMNHIQARGQNLAIELGQNPFDCKEFCKGNFAFWLRDTNVTVRNKDSLRCVPRSGPNGVANNVCAQVWASEKSSSGSHHAAAIILGVLLGVLVVTLGVAMYLNRTSLSYKLNPIVDSVSRKVRYTSIDHPEEQEMNV